MPPGEIGSVTNHGGTENTEKASFALYLFAFLFVPPDGDTFN